eukprot:5993772-Amphidinium_carterae.1
MVDLQLVRGSLATTTVQSDRAQANKQDGIWQIPREGVPGGTGELPAVGLGRGQVLECSRMPSQPDPLCEVGADLRTSPERSTSILPSGGANLGSDGGDSRRSHVERSDPEERSETQIRSICLNGCSDGSGDTVI